MTANIPMSGYKITGVGAGTARTDAATLATIQDGTGVYVGTVGGTADVITLTPSPAITSYTAGQTFRFIASGTNTTNVTVNVSGLGAKAVQLSGSALAGGEIVSGKAYGVLYDGTQFQLVTVSVTPFIATLVNDASASAARATLVAAQSGSVTGSDLTMATARVLGRTTASTGAIEEISIGASLTLSGGSLSGTAASATQAGVAELATSAEVQTGTDTGRVPSVDTLRQGFVVMGGPYNTTSGTTVDVTGIPSWVTTIVIHLSGFSTSGNDSTLIKIGDAGGLETSGYSGSMGYFSTSSQAAASYGASTGYVILPSVSAAYSFYVTVTLQLTDRSANTWGISVNGADSNQRQVFSVGSKSLSATLDRFTLTTSGGTDTLDAGVMGYFYY